MCGKNPDMDMAGQGRAKHIEMTVRRWEAIFAAFAASNDWANVVLASVVSTESENMNSKVPYF